MQLDSLGLMSKEAVTKQNIYGELTQDLGAMPDFSDCPYSLDLDDSWYRDSDVMLRIAKRFGVLSPRENMLGYNRWHFYKILHWIHITDGIGVCYSIEDRILKNDLGL
jgi:hypothetical protein